MESREVFPDEVEVKTLHSFCYDVVIRQGLGSSVPGPRTITPHFGFRDVSKELEDEDRQLVVDLMEEFFGSGYTNIIQFFRDRHVKKYIGNYVIMYIEQMINKERGATFEFIIKYYHILLSRQMFVPATYEAIYYDECQDQVAAGLEILKLLPAKRKIIVGDRYQLLYGSFTQAINGFEYLKKDIATTLTLTTSYRVNSYDATYVQAFMQKYVKSDFQFIGHDHKDHTIETTGYLTRTNASLIAKMIELDNDGVEYGLVRSVGNLFQTVLTLASLKVGNHITGELSYLNHDIENYAKNKKINKKTTSLFKYVLQQQKDNRKLKTSFALIINHGSKQIWNLYNKTKKIEKSKVKHTLLLGTVFGFKGFTVDRAVLDDDLNLKYINDDKMSDADKLIEHYIRYVAISRHKHRLDGASWLYDI